MNNGFMGGRINGDVTIEWIWKWVRLLVMLSDDEGFAFALIWKPYHCICWNIDPNKKLSIW